jgi:iron complex outermembrane receptor protein
VVDFIVSDLLYDALTKKLQLSKKEVCTDSLYLCSGTPGVLQHNRPATETVPLNLIRVIPAKGGFSSNAVIQAVCLLLRANPIILKNGIMLRICLFLSVFFLLAVQGIGQVYILKGKVLTAEGMAEGASLQLSGPIKLFTTSNPDGSFLFEKLPIGMYELTCTFSGFIESKQKIEVSTSQNPLLITLQPLSQSLQPVEVKALRANSLAPFSKTDLSKNFIEKNNLGQDIPMLLNQTPNVVSFSDAGNGVGYTGLRIRGTDATRINMTINGIPYNDPESQGTFFVNLPDFLSGTTSVQVQRGVGTSSNGPGAFGASMNFSTHENTRESYLELNNSYGSFNTIKNTLKLGTALFNEKISLDIRLSRISSDGYIDRATSSLQGAYLGASWHLPKSTFRFNAILGKEKTYQAWYGISADDLKNNRTFNPAGTEKPGEPYENETDNYRQNHYQFFYNTEISKFLTFNTAIYLTAGKGYYEQYKADEDPADYGLAGTDETDLIRQLWLDNTLFGQNFNLQYSKGNHDLTWGGSWNHYPGNHFGKVIWTATNPQMAPHTWYDLDAQKTDLSTFIKWQHKLGNYWHLFTDLQYRHVQYELNGFRNNPALRFNETWNFLNPKAGITWNKNNWTAYASYAMANKEPNRDDFEAGTNQTPLHEQLHNVEIGVQKKELIPGLQVALNGYLMYYRDQLVLTGKINDVGAYTRTNLPESYRIGTEMEARYYKPNWGFAWSLGLSSNRAIDYTGYYDDYDNGGQIEVKYGNTQIALSPGMVQQLTFDVRPIKSLEISLLNKYVGKQYLDNSGNEDRALDAFWTTDTRIIYNLPVKNALKRVRLVLQANNLFNSMYEPNGYTFSYLYGGQFTTENFFFPMAGTNYMVALNIKL